jgi:hypothetical protein
MVVRRSALAVLLASAAGCASAPEPERPPRTFVHAASAHDARLIEALEAGPVPKEPPGPLEIALKMPLAVPNTVAIFVREAPGALAAFVMTPVALGAALLEAVGILKPARETPFEFVERPR